MCVNVYEINKRFTISGRTGLGASLVAEDVEVAE